MAAKSDTQKYGAELGKGIKESLQGLNTNASPKKRRTAMLLIIIPLVLFLTLFAIGISKDNDTIASIGLMFGMCLGLYQFYVGKIKKGLLYSITMGGFVIGCIIDLFKLLIKTFRDVNGFPLLY